MLRTGRQREGVGVPVEDAEGIVAEPFRRLRLRARGDVDPADLRLGGARHLAAQRGSHQLTAQAMAEHRHVVAHRGADQCLGFAQEGQIVVDAHRPAEHAEAAEFVERARQGFAVPGVEHAHRDRPRRQEIAEVTGIIVAGILDHGDRLHAASCVRQSSNAASTRAISSSPVAGHTSIMLWKGVIITPRLSSVRWIACDSS